MQSVSFLPGSRLIFAVRDLFSLFTISLNVRKNIICRKQGRI